MKRVMVFLMSFFSLFSAGCDAQPTPSPAGKPNVEGMTQLPSGLKYRVLKEGTGAKPAATDQVEVHYRGMFLDGKEFDSSYKRKEPTTFPVNRVIKGWTEALLLMKEGSKWELAIPPDIAYGKNGMPPVIPPDATLFFEVELLKIVK